MASDAKTFIDSFFSITKGFIDKNKETSTIQFLTTAVETMTAVLAKIDKFLQSKDVNVKEHFTSVTDKISNFMSKGKEKLSEASGEVKSKGIRQFVKDKKDSITGKLKEKFSSDEEKTAGPPEEDKSFLGKMMEKLSSSIDNLATATDGKATTDSEKEEENRKGMLQRMRDSLTKQKERSDKRGKEVGDETNRFGKDDKKKPGGMFGMLLSAIGGLSSVILGGFKGVMTTFVPFLAKMVGRGIVSTITSVVPWMLKKMTGPLLGLTKTLLGGAARGALTAAGGMLSGAASAAGSAVAAVATGTAGMVLGGVLLAGAAIYGGYKLYKYLNRNNTGNGVYSDLTRLRLQLYGFSDIHRDHYHKLFDLEMLMQQYHEYRNNNFTLKKFDDDFKKKTMEIFEVTRDEKEKYGVLNKWFIQRFLPSYKAFMEAFYSANPKIYLDDLDKLKGEELFKLISVLRIPSGVFEVKYVPVFANPTAVVDKQQIDDLLNSIREAVKKMTDEGKGKTPTQISQDNKSQTKTSEAGKSIDDKAIKDKAASALPQTDKTESTQSTARKADMAAPSAGEEGEGKPADTQEQTLSDKASQSISKATGELIRGNKSLEGIATKLNMSKIYNLDPNVLELFSGMAKEYNTLTGKSINVNEAFRSKQDQAAIYQKYGPGRAAPPGTSLHEHGLAIDINSVDADELDKLGLMRKYGFTRPIGGEKWHIEPAGVALNPTLARDQPDSRMRAVMSSIGRGGGGFATEDGATKYKRNINLQKSIFDSVSGKDIDPLKEVGKKLQEAAATSQTNGAAVTRNNAPSTVTTQDSMGKGEQVVSGSTSAKTDTPAAGNFPLFHPNFDYEQKPPSMDNRKGLDKSPQPVNPYNSNIDPNQTGPMTPEAAIKKAASLIGMNADTMTAFARIESSMNPNAANRASSATGLFQITSGTWKDLMKKYSQQYNIPPDALPTDPYYNSLLGGLYAKENLKSMAGYQNAGVREDVALYLVHHFGPSGGARIVKAMAQNPNGRINDAVSSDAYNSNRQELGGKTVGQYVDYLSAKLTKAGSTLTTPQANNQQASTSPPINPASIPAGDSPYPVDNSKPSAYTNQPPLMKPKADQTSPLRPSLPPSDPTPQPSQASNLNKSESLLSGMSETLLAIKQVLMSIDNKTGGDGQKKQDKQESPVQQQQQAINVDSNRMPSQTSVSMSRKPVSA